MHGDDGFEHLTVKSSFFFGLVVVLRLLTWTQFFFSSPKLECLYLRENPPQSCSLATSSSELDDFTRSVHLLPKSNQVRHPRRHKGLPHLVLFECVAELVNRTLAPFRVVMN